MVRLRRIDRGRGGCLLVLLTLLVLEGRREVAQRSSEVPLPQHQGDQGHRKEDHPPLILQYPGLEIRAPRSVDILRQLRQRDGHYRVCLYNAWTLG